MQYFVLLVLRHFVAVQLAFLEEYWLSNAVSWVQFPMLACWIGQGDFSWVSVHISGLYVGFFLQVRPNIFHQWPELTDSAQVQAVCTVGGGHYATVTAFWKTQNVFSFCAENLFGYSSVYCWFKDILWLNNGSDKVLFKRDVLGRLMIHFVSCIVIKQKRKLA